MSKPRVRDSRGLARILFVPDTHVPYHDAKAWNVLLAAGEKLKPTYIVLLGDFADFYAVSAHSKNPERAADLQYEVGIAKDKLRELSKLGASSCIYLAGNHEDRLERYLKDRAPALFGTVKIPEVLGLVELGWQYIPYRKSYRLGKLHLTHDAGRSNHNAHRHAMDAFRGSAIIGHTHRMELSVHGNADGKPSLGAMFGWLGDFDQVDYMHQITARSSWVHGFGVGFLEQSGIVHVQPVPIVDGFCVILGEVVRV